MAYTKQNFVDGEILTHTKLNAMDDQIALNEGNIAKQYELFETITLTEDAASIERTASDATFFNCSRVYVGISTVAVESGTASISVRVRYGGNTIGQIQLDSAITTSARRMHSELYSEHGLWTCVGTTPTASEGNKAALNVQTRSEPKLVTDYPYVSRLEIYSGSESIPIPAGTVIKVYGVKV